MKGSLDEMLEYLESVLYSTKMSEPVPSASPTASSGPDGNMAVVSPASSTTEGTEFNITFGNFEAVAESSLSAKDDSPVPVPLSNVHPAATKRKTNVQRAMARKKAFEAHVEAGDEAAKVSHSHIL